VHSFYGVFGFVLVILFFFALKRTDCSDLFTNSKKWEIKRHIIDIVLLYLSPEAFYL